MKKESKTNILNWKNCISLSLIAYGLYIILWLIVGDEDLTVENGGSFMAEMLIDFVLCILFTFMSLLYSHLLFRFIPSEGRSYKRLVIYTCLLFLLNNLMAYGMTEAYNRLLESSFGEAFYMKNVYIYGMIATFISCIYSCAIYLESYIQANDEKSRLETALMKKKEIALQSQLQFLKAQIGPHFMFNNFSILSELIEENPALAECFLSNLSKVYRYIIQNLERTVISVCEEIRFLDSYLYLIKMRYGESVVVHIEDSLRKEKKSIPPACLQLLVENAIKHNGHSPDAPLSIDILRIENHIVVRNLLSPLLSSIESTGLGQKNIRERYALLSHQEVIIQKTDRDYSVSLPILNNTH